MEKLRQAEEKYRKKRTEEGRSVIGAAKLRRKNLDLSYIPNRTGRRTWIICSDIGLRIKIIEYIKSLVKQAKDVYCRWKQGDFSISYPPGLYPPCMPKVCEATCLDIDNF